MAEPHSTICAVITEGTTEAAKAAIGRAAEVADLIEVRLDYLRDFNFSKVEELRGLLENHPLPVIITCRDINEGGVQKIDDEVRYRLLAEGARKYAEYCDIEAAHYEKLTGLAPDLSKLIVSYHDFEATPDNLEEIYQRITRFPAAIHKITVRAHTVTDTLPIFRLLAQSQKAGKPMIAISMNEAGLLTRLLGPSRGSFLTYGALEAARQSAPGQITCSEMKNLYRLAHLTTQTEITGIIGNPVHHSASPAMHNSAFSALQMNSVYLPVAVDNLNDFFIRFVHPQTRVFDWKLRGLSVTIPHKVEVMALLDEIDPTAAAIGAVNTLVLNGNSVKGCNTDVWGAIEPLQQSLPLNGTRCGVLGAGGAARAVVYGLSERGADVTIFARDRQKAATLASRFTARVEALEALASYPLDVLINTTPIGMSGHSENQSLVPPTALRNIHIVYDLVYNPLETRLLREAREAGCRIIDGLSMLVAQAALQFELWTGQKPPIDVMRQAALQKLV